MQTHKSRVEPFSNVVSIDSGGHRERVLARRDELVKEHLWLVPPIAMRIYLNVPMAFELNDLVALGNLGLVHAATRYRPCAHGDAPFSAYARPRIHGAILDSMRRKRWKDSTMDPLPENIDTIADTRDRTEQEIDEARIRAVLAEAISWLTDPEREVIRRHYAQGASWERIGAALGLPVCRVLQDRDRALARLKRRMKLAGIEEFAGVG